MIMFSIVKQKVPVLSFLFFLLVNMAAAQSFVHPGGVHTLADLDRMKAKVAAGAHPWIDGWNMLIKDPKAQKTFVARPHYDISVNGIPVRQRAAGDATAAYFNTLRWYISGDTTYANCAVRILNAWSATINQVSQGELFQLPIMMMVQAGELLRIYPGWAAEDFARFKNMCLNYFYPACHNFIGKCGSWPGWDGPANACIMYIGILCDDQVKFEEAVNYYKNGDGGGSVTRAIFPSGQITEIGRDQPHAEIGINVMAEICQTALNQGVDLYSFADNRLLTGFEYYCKLNLNHPIDWVSYNDCKDHNFYYPAYRFENRISKAPTYELVYNHYVVKKGLRAPYTRAMINLRGLAPTDSEYAGYCALTYTLSDTTTIFQPRPVPAPPVNLKATPGVSNVVLTWKGSGIDDANGYNVLRSTTAGGPYITIARWGGTSPVKVPYNTSTYYTDTTVSNGITYYYRVSANNQSGTSANSAEVSTTSVSCEVSLPKGWAMGDIGSVATAGSAGFARVNGNTFIVKASGNKFGTSNDSYGYLYTRVSGDFTITSHVFNVILSPTNANRVGLVMRASFDTSSAIASISLGDNGFRYVSFASHATGGRSAWKPGDSHTWLPVWFRLKRNGHTFTGYQSVNGVTWIEVGSTAIAMPAEYYVGMFVNSGSTKPGMLTTATFNNVTTAGNRKMVNDKH